MTKLMKEQASLGMPWEEEYGYAQAVKVGDTVYLSGQVSHDDDANVLGTDDMEVQMRAAYGNIAKVLAQYTRRSRTSWRRRSTSSIWIAPTTRA